MMGKPVRWHSRFVLAYACQRGIRKRSRKQQAQREVSDQSTGVKQKAARKCINDKNILSTETHILEALTALNVAVEMTNANRHDVQEHVALHN